MAGKSVWTILVSFLVKVSDIDFQGLKWYDSVLSCSILIDHSVWAGLTASGGGWAGLLPVGSSSQGLNCPCRGWTAKHGAQGKAVVRFTAGQAASVQL